MARNNVRDTWTPEGKRFMQNLKELSKLEVKIGFQGGKDYYEEDGKHVNVLDIAMFNELGTVNIPSRPFMRKSVDENQSKINAFLEVKRNELANGKSAQAVLNEIGVFMKGLVQEKIVSGSFVANAPSTVEKKGSSRPLVDTGLMRQSVNFEVKRKGVR